MTQNHLSAHLLNSLPSLHYKRFKAVVNHFPDFQTAWEDFRMAELQAAGLKSEVAECLCQEKKNINPDEEYKKLTNLQIELMIRTDREYPALLKEIFDPPFILYRLGQAWPMNKPNIAIVGTRRCSVYGRQVTNQIVRSLANYQPTIVSGLALGIDAVAHQAALVNNCFTIGVCAFGFNHIYPPENRHLAEQIKQAGALISEFPLDKKPEPYCFPLRNRIISGLCAATIVIEAKEKSGALITAQSALDQGREVWAVPGDITRDTSFGPNKLIRDGQAAPLLQAQDILEKLNIEPARSVEMSRRDVSTNQPLLHFAPNEQQIYQLLQTNLHIDDLIRQTNLSPSVVSSLLTKMELKGIIKNWGGMVWGRNY